MENFKNYRFPVPAAARQASLVSIDADLKGVISYCNYMLEHSDDKQLNFTVWEAMSSAVVVRYARCFSSGTRDQLPHGLLLGADLPLREAHEYFIALRSKHFAHSVNPFEENEVTLQIGDHFRSSDEIVSINSFHARTVGLPLSDPERLKQLAVWVSQKVSKMMEEERAKLLAIVRTCPLAELKTYGSPSAGSGGNHSNVGKRRDRP